MSELLGKKRIQLLAFMLVLNAGLVGNYYYYIQPLKQERVREFQSVRADVRSRRSEIRQLKTDFVRLLPKITDYNNLQDEGFFNDQRRTMAQEKITAFRDQANLLVARYQIEPADILEDPRAKDANHVVLSSLVSVELEALDDTDIYTFISLMKRDFPGYIDIRKIRIQRRQRLSSDLLINVASGKPEVLIKANMKFHWRTMTPESSLDEL